MNWGTLLKVGAGIAGAPFTGGMSLIPALTSAGLDVAGGIAGGMSKGRADENQAAQQSAQLGLQESKNAEDALMNRQGLDLRQRQFGQDSESDSFRKALQGALTMNMRDVTANRPEGIPTIAFGGGGRPSAIGQEGRDAGALLNSKAMQKLIGGEKFDELPPIERMQSPEFKGAGFWENLMGGAGAVGKGLSGAQALNSQSGFQQQIQKMIEELSNSKRAPAEEVVNG